MARPKSADPLIEALIKRLPPGDTEWPVEKQLAWLNLMAMAFGTVYGGDAAARLTPASPPPLTVGYGNGVAVVGSALPPLPPSSRPKKLALHKFLVDDEGYARRNNGDRILPKDVTDILYDHRGLNGDMATITWADDSTGIGGHDVTVVAA
jgi:hypothetical protein